MEDNFSSPIFIAKLVNGDPLAMQNIVKKYTTHLVKTGLGIGLSKEGSEEVTHATWETFFKIIKRFESRSHIRTFIFGIFYNKISEYKKTRIKVDRCDPIEEITEQYFLDDGHFRQHQMGPEQYIEERQTMDIINLCLENLPLSQRLAFSMKIVEELDTQDICNALDISDTNLRQLLFRAKNRLKSCVDAKLKSGGMS